jgi:hypothetical protein
MRAVALLTDLVDGVEAGLGRHELEDVVDGEHAAHFTLVS